MFWNIMESFYRVLPLGKGFFVALLWFQQHSFQVQILFLFIPNVVLPLSLTLLPTLTELTSKCYLLYQRFCSIFLVSIGQKKKKIYYII